MKESALRARVARKRRVQVIPIIAAPRPSKQASLPTPVGLKDSQGSSASGEIPARWLQARHMTGMRVPPPIFALLLLLSLLVSCCRTVVPVLTRPDPQGLQAQRRLIEEAFQGTDIRSDPGALADFRVGKRDTVSAAWWGFDPEDSTESLQNGLNSGARVVLVPSMDRPWVTQPLLLRSHTTLILQEGVELVARKGSFHDVNNSMLALENIDDVVIWGYGARLVMRKADYRKAPYESSQWRHAIDIYGCARVSVLGLEEVSSGGDGVYLGRGERIANQQILLKDLILRDNYRQGISVIAAEDLLIENVEMSRTEGTLPGSGIDFEPNYPDESFSRCVLRNCVIDSNAGAGIAVVLAKYDTGSPEIDIRVEDSFVANNFLSFLVAKASKARGRIQFIRTTLRGIQFITPGTRVTVSGNRSK